MVLFLKNIFGSVALWQLLSCIGFATVWPCISFVEVALCQYYGCLALWQYYGCLALCQYYGCLALWQFCGLLAGLCLVLPQEVAALAVSLEPQVGDLERAQSGNGGGDSYSQGDADT